MSMSPQQRCVRPAGCWLRMQQEWETQRLLEKESSAFPLHHSPGGTDVATSSYVRLHSQSAAVRSVPRREWLVWQFHCLDGMRWQLLGLRPEHATDLLLQRSQRIWPVLCSLALLKVHIHIDVLCANADAPAPAEAESDAAAAAYSTCLPT